MKTTMGQLPIPGFYKPRNAERWEYSPNQSVLSGTAAEWRRAHGIKPAASDATSIHLLLIDVQKDFCFPPVFQNGVQVGGGTLYVGGRSGRGAIEDSDRTAQFIYRNVGRITDVTTTLDTHFAYQLFFPWFWCDENDQPLNEHTLVVTDGNRLMNIDLAGNVLHKVVTPNPAVAKWLCNGNYTWLCEQVAFYCGELKKAGKYTLYLWPPHCVLGSDGHALVGVIHEVRLFQSFVRGSQSNCEVKGGHPLTENYSVLRPEVLTRFDGRPLAQKNTRFLETLLNNDIVVIGGQAASHCVKSSIEDFLDEILAKDPALAKKVYILSDCTSAVAVPDGKGGLAADFTPQAEEAMAKFANAGMNLVRSVDPIESWPNVNL